MPSSVRAFTTAALALSLASAARAGIQFGSPVPGAIAGTSPAVGVTSWALPVYRLRLTRCSDSATVYHYVNATISGSNHLYPPSGCWSAVVIETSGDFTFSGTTPDSYALSMTLVADEIALDLEHNLDVVTSSPTETGYIELFEPDWYDIEIAPYVSSGQAVTINSNHARHAAMVATLESDSVLLFDPL